LWKDALQYDLHPEIPVGPNMRIADVATGNGFVCSNTWNLHDRVLTPRSIWLLDLARKLPSTTKLDGFDISLDQCPPQAWLPDNVDLHTWNLLEAPPAKFVGAFDVVHIRLITVAVQNNDPRPILASLHSLLSAYCYLNFGHDIWLTLRILEPGGYIQWDEADSVDWNVKSVHHSVEDQAVRDLFQQLCGTHESVILRTFATKHR
jgi:hypothetical protein